MSDILCGYKGDRAAALMAYLYDEIAPPERAEFEGHLATCARCRAELKGLGGVRTQLASWAPPEPGFAIAGRGPTSVAGRQVAIETASEAAVAPARESWWRTMPVWTQAAAAMLIVGVSAAIANLDVHYDARSGLDVRTGWSRAAGVAAAGAVQPSSLNQSAAMPANVALRDDLAALEQQLRRELRAQPAAAAPHSAAADTDLLRRVRSLVEESEKRQQRELALRVAEVLRDVSNQRTTDLRRIDQNLGLIEDRTGVAIMKNRQMVDYYMQRVSQRQ